jgi:hypothetical protein
MTPVELFSVFASAFGWATSVSDENVLTVNECPFHDGPDEFCDAIENTISTLMARAGNGNIVRCQSRKSPGQKSCQYLIVALRKDSRQ